MKGTKDREQYGRACQPKIHDTEELAPVNHVRASGGLGDIASELGLGTTDPSRMSADDTARLMNYARSEHPEVLQKTVEEKPWFVKAMGNPVIMGVLAMAAAKLGSSQRPKN